MKYTIHTCVILFAIMQVNTLLLGQSNPTPHVLANSNITFGALDDPSNTKYPLYIMGWNGISPFQTAGLAAPDSIEVSGDAPLYGPGHDNLTSSVMSENAGLSIRGSMYPEEALSVVFSIDTRNCKGISIFWKAFLVHNFVNTPSELHLQYRIGNTGNWTNVPGHVYNMKAFGGENAPAETFGPYQLSDSLEGKPEVQFQWLTIRNAEASTRENQPTGRVMLDSISITSTESEPVPPTSNFTVSKQNPGAEEPVTFEDRSSGEPNSWNWDFGDGTNDTKKNPLKVYEQNGSYSVTLISSNEVGSDTLYKENFITVGPLSVERKNPMLFRYFPNPANHQLNVIKQDDLITDYIVVNINGQIIQKGDFKRNKEIDISTLSPGTYILKLLDSKTQSHSLFIKE